MMKRVIIVGGGFAGINAAKALAVSQAEVLLLDRRNHHLSGFRNRLLVLVQWAWSYLTYARGARLIIGKEWRRFPRKHDGER